MPILAELLRLPPSQKYTTCRLLYLASAAKMKLLSLLVTALFVPFAQSQTVNCVADACYNGIMAYPTATARGFCFTWLTPNAAGPTATATTRTTVTVIRPTTSVATTTTSTITISIVTSVARRQIISAAVSSQIFAGCGSLSSRVSSACICYITSRR
ncbi:hypothetical protein QBC35DRAFT_536511 [Podospora australis]|uniref:Uncharacterized protein n=1 Tax=Podospora australis TaxID=1536484 RepID=A0AAN6WHU9_9PEZI|nr:hypothetical protein QBC35DRAFT_536511 [Podospora australis]